MVELVLFGSFVLLLALGVPVAFSMGLSSFVTITYMQGMKALLPTAGVMNAALSSETLLAIPFFILAGVIMEFTGLSGRLIAFADALVGHRKSGIALTTIMTALIFSSISGSGPATVAAIGGILIPALIANGYRKRHAAALMASAGEMGIIIPPSIAYIVFAVVASDYERVSIGRLFIAGVVPGLMLAVVFYLIARFLPRSMDAAIANAAAHGEKARHRLGLGGGNPQVGAARGGSSAGSLAGANTHAPTAPEGSATVSTALLPTVELGACRRRAPWNVIWASFVRAIPGLLMPVIILGGIYGGVFTPTESAAVAVIYALVAGLVVTRELRVRELYRVFTSAGVQASRIMFIIATATLFAYVITKFQIARTVAAGLLSLTDNLVILLLLVNVVLLIAGMFLDAISAFYLFVPLFVPVLLELGMDITTIGVFMTLNLAIGLVTPPVGLDLFVAAGIARIPFFDAAKGIGPFLAGAIGVLLLVVFLPVLSNGLPDLLGL